MHSVLPFTDRCTSVLLNVITRPVQHHRWYYAGCGNNMEEQQCDACCCSARRAFAIHGVSATVDEECSQRVDLLQQTWRVISADGQCRVERCFQAARGDTSGQYIALKNSCIVSGVTGCDRYYPSPGTALYIDYSSVNSAVVQSTRFSVFSSVIQHH